MNTANVELLNLVCTNTSSSRVDSFTVNQQFQEQRHPFEFAPPLQGKSRLELKCPHCGDTVRMVVISMEAARRASRRGAMIGKIVGIAFLVLLYAGLLWMGVNIHPAFPITIGLLVFGMVFLPSLLATKAENNLNDAIWKYVDLWHRHYFVASTSPSALRRHHVEPREGFEAAIREGENKPGNPQSSQERQP